MWRSLYLILNIAWTSNSDRSYRDLTSVDTTYNYEDDIEDYLSDSSEDDDLLRHKRSSFYR